MSDFKTILLERRAASEARRAGVQAAYEEERLAVEARFQKAMGQLADEIAAIETLLIIEAEREGNPASRPPAPRMRLPLADFIMTTIRSKNGWPVSKDELRLAAEVSGYENAGRAVHAALISLIRSGRVAEIGDATYAVPETPIQMQTAGPDLDDREPAASKSSELSLEDVL